MTSKFVIVKYGNVYRDEYMNCALIAWATGDDGEPVSGDDTVLFVHILKDWSRIERAFPEFFSEKKPRMLVFLDNLKCYFDYASARHHYSPFKGYMLTDERPSTLSPQDTLDVLKDTLVLEPKYNVEDHSSGGQEIVKLL